MNSGISSGPHRGSDDFSPMDEKNALYVSYFVLFLSYSVILLLKLIQAWLKYGTILAPKVLKAHYTNEYLLRKALT